jgi:hypothetical protein
MALENSLQRRALWECDMALENSLQGLQLWFRPRPDPRLGQGAMKFQSPGTPTGTVLGQLQDSISGVPRKSDIWMPLPQSNAEYTIGSKVVAYSQVRAVVCLVVQSARGKSRHPRVSRNVN